MSTRVHLVPPYFYPEDIEQCHFVTYAADGGFEGGLANQGEFVGVPDEELQAFANVVNEEFALRTMPNGRITMFPAELVRYGNVTNAMRSVPLIQMMLELWALRMVDKMPNTVVFIISNMWNPDITTFHAQLAESGYPLRGVKDLYVWTM